MTAAELAERLGGKRVGSSWKALCPAHNDQHTPNLNIKDGDKGVVFHCFAGCTQEAVLAALADRGIETRELFAVPTTSSRKWTKFDADCALANRGLRAATITYFKIVPDLDKQAWAFPLGKGGKRKYKAFPPTNGR